MKLLAKINDLTGAGYSVEFKPLPYGQGVEVKVGIKGCVSSWYLTPNAMAEVNEEIVTDILDKLAEDIKAIRSCANYIQSKVEENEHE